MNYKSPKISVVIPCYKVEQYISECLMSIITSSNNSKKNDGIEIICVNDGSPDNTVKIINEEFKSHIDSGLIRIIHQENKGLSSARNFGASHIKGKYIAFIDADDCVSIEYFECIFKALEEKPDIISFNLSLFINSTKNVFKNVSIHNKNGLYLSNQVISDEYKSGHWFACCRIYKTNLIRENPFPNGMLFEDIMTIPFLYLKELKIYYINNYLYLYRQNPDGLSAKITPKHLADMRKFHRSLILLKPNPHIDILISQVIKLYVSFSLRLNYPIYKYFQSYQTLNTSSPKPWNARYSVHLFPLNHTASYFIVKRIKYAIGSLFRKFFS